MENWVAEAAQLTKPDKVVFCDGSESENAAILEEMVVTAREHSLKVAT